MEEVSLPLPAMQRVLRLLTIEFSFTDIVLTEHEVHADMVEAWERAEPSAPGVLEPQPPPRRLASPVLDVPAALLRGGTASAGHAVAGR